MHGEGVSHTGPPTEDAPRAAASTEQCASPRTVWGLVGRGVKACPLTHPRAGNWPTLRPPVQML